MSRITASILLSTVIISLGNNFLVSAASGKEVYKKQQTSGKSKKNAAKIAEIYFGSIAGLSVLAAVGYGLYCLCNKSKNPSEEKPLHFKNGFSTNNDYQYDMSDENVVSDPFILGDTQESLNRIFGNSKEKPKKYISWGRTETGRRTFLNKLFGKYDCNNDVPNLYMSDNNERLLDIPGSEKYYKTIQTYLCYADKVLLWINPKKSNYIDLLSEDIEIVNKNIPLTRIIIIVSPYASTDEEWKVRKETVATEIREKFGDNIQMFEFR